MAMYVLRLQLWLDLAHAAVGGAGRWRAPRAAVRAYEIGGNDELPGLFDDTLDTVIDGAGAERLHDKFVDAAVTRGEDIRLLGTSCEHDHRQGWVRRIGHADFFQQANTVDAARVPFGNEEIILRKIHQAQRFLGAANAFTIGKSHFDQHGTQHMRQLQVGIYNQDFIIFQRV